MPLDRYGRKVIDVALVNISSNVLDIRMKLANYKLNLKYKINDFLERLSDEGIMAAKQNTGEYEPYILFGKQLNPRKYGATMIVFGMAQDITRSWKSGPDSERTAFINPLMMAEFGSGSQASDASGKPNADAAKKVGMGQGTFFPSGKYSPDSPQYNHAFDLEWYWYDLDGNIHSSSGEEPTMPMYHAAEEMRNKIYDIARQVFG